MRRIENGATMIAIKILCGCGQKYAFDVEPVGGRMGDTVQCPVCGADGAAAANELIAQHMAAQAAPAPALRIGGQKPPPAVPRPLPHNLAGAAQVGNSRGAKLRTKWLVPAICGVAVLILVLAGTLLFGRSPDKKHESAGPLALADDGLPHTLEELNAWYVEPPAGQNAATFYSQGFNALQLGNVGSSNLPLLGQGQLPPLGAVMPGSVKAALAAFVKSNRDALQFFAQGAKYEQSRYPLDLTQGVYTVLPHLAKIKSATIAMELSAVWHAEGKEGKPAANDVLMALALARSLEAEPSLISQLMRAATVSIAVAALEQTLNRTALPRESLSDLRKAFQKMEDYDARGEGFNRALAAERAISMTLLAKPQEILQVLTLGGMNISAAESNQMAAVVQKAGSLKEEQHYYEETFQQLMAARQELFPDRLKTEDLIRQRVTAAADKKFVFTKLLISGFTGPIAKEAGCLAALRLGSTAVALEQFRAAHQQKYPAALSELTPDYLAAAQADPFDGQPLRYRQNGAGYLLYSIGPDRQDDSGRRLNGKEGDIIFSVPTPGKPGE